MGNKRKNQRGYKKGKRVFKGNQFTAIQIPTAMDSERDRDQSLPEDTPPVLAESVVDDDLDSSDGEDDLEDDGGDVEQLQDHGPSVSRIVHLPSLQALASLLPCSYAVKIVVLRHLRK